MACWRICRAEERTRLIRAAGQIYNPDTAARRHLVKAIEKKRKAARVSKDDRVLHETGIRALRRQPVFTTPNVFAPTSFEPSDVPPADERRSGKARARRRRRVGDRDALLRLQAAVSSRSITSTISCVRRAPR